MARTRAWRLSAIARGIGGSLLAPWRRTAAPHAGGAPGAARIDVAQWHLGRLFVLDITRRFGLIDAEDGRIVYFPLDAAQDARLEAFVEGAPLLFDETRDRLGRQARTVVLICAGAAAMPAAAEQHAPARTPAASETLPRTPAGVKEDEGRSRSVA